MTFNRQRVGEVRPTQIIHNFGVGSIVDLPNFSAMVMGLDDWESPTPETTISESRLLNLVKSHLGAQVQQLAGPIVTTNDRSGIDPFDPELKKGVPVSPFPRWVRCPNCDLIAPLDYGVFKLDTDPWYPDRTCFVHDTCSKAVRPPAVVPVRFVMVCEHGHLQDFPWLRFVHGEHSSCRGPLRLREFGVSAEAADIVVKCDECDTSRRMLEAFTDQGHTLLGKCSGHHPHTRSYSACEQEPRAILTGASNLWFPVAVSSLGLPGEAGDLAALVKEHWAVLEKITTRDRLEFAREMGKLDAFAEIDDEELWEAIEVERSGDAGENEPRSTFELKIDEWALFSDPINAPRNKDFHLTEVPVPKAYEKYFERVVLVERLRIVKALIGFTRLVSPGDYADPSEIEEAWRGPLARSAPSWVPAAEVRGEGIFIQFNERTLSNWLKDNQLRSRIEAFEKAHTAFRRARHIDNPEQNFPGARYILMHSFSHALIRQLSIECGYSAASLQERIYSRDPEAGEESMAGILLYTAASDSEGTLGGLVNLGKPENFRRHIDLTLEAMKLCASDPLCSEHSPAEEGTSLHGACCHACLFASETSCERGNKYLDRSMLVKTFGGPAIPFFEKRE